MVKKIEDIFIHFDSIHDRDRRKTDTQTPHDGSRACVASRDKNRRAADRYTAIR